MSTVHINYEASEGGTIYSYNLYLKCLGGFPANSKMPNKYLIKLNENIELPNLYLKPRALYRAPDCHPPHLSHSMLRIGSLLEPSLYLAPGLNHHHLFCLGYCYCLPNSTVLVLLENLNHDNICW